MDQQRGLLQAILTDPDDDAPRLIYADWLEDQDETDRANFIRVQCELAHTARYHPATRARWVELKQEEASLWERNKAPWLRELPDVPGFWWDTPFARGFPARFKPDSVHLLLDQAHVWLELPVCCGVRLTNADGINRLADAPVLAHLRLLDFECWLGEVNVSLLARSPFLDNLCVLDLSRNNLSDLSIRPLARARQLTRLHTLALERNFISDDGITELIATPRLAGLRTLNVNYNQITTTGARALAATPGLSRLTQLSLAGNQLGDDGIVALALSPHVSNLELLDVRNTGMTARGAQALLESPQLRHGLVLDLRGENALKVECSALLKERFHCLF